MAARKDAMERFRMNKIPAGYTDFEYNISPHLDRIDRPTAQHELGHYVDFNLSQNANADYNNNMFSALRKDLSTDSNPLYPGKTDYFRQGTEQKSYMNTLRSYMQSIGLMDRPGQKVTTKTIKRAINSLPSEMNAVRAAYLQFSSPGKYTKWFNKIPLLSIPGAAIYLDSKEDNSYSKGTDGIIQSYSLPEIVVTPSEYQNYYMENIRPKDMPEGEYFLKTILPPGIESTRFTKEQQDDRLRKLKEIYELAGEPTVHYKGIIDRPHYIPVLNSIYSANNDYNLISELAHPIQLKKGKNRHFIKNAINNTIDDIRGNRDYYKDKDNYEYETHSIIEPALRNYIQNRYNSLDDALEDANNKYADGTDGIPQDNTFVLKPQLQKFIPATGAYKILNDYQYKYGSKSQYKGGNVEIVSPEFNLLTFGLWGGINGIERGVAKAMSKPANYKYPIGETLKDAARVFQETATSNRYPNIETMIDAVSRANTRLRRPIDATVVNFGSKMNRKYSFFSDRIANTLGNAYEAIINRHPVLNSIENIYNIQQDNTNKENKSN